MKTPKHRTPPNCYKTANQTPVYRSHTTRQERTHTAKIFSKLIFSLDSRKRERERACKRRCDATIAEISRRRYTCSLSRANLARCVCPPSFAFSRTRHEILRAFLYTANHQHRRTNVATKPPNTEPPKTEQKNLPEPPTNHKNHQSL